MLLQATSRIRLLRKKQMTTEFLTMWAASWIIRWSSPFVIKYPPREVGSGEGGAQCVEMKLRWQFYVHASKYMPWTVLLIIVLNNFWYFKHQILTRICSDAYLKHNWRNCLWKEWKLTISEDNFFNNVSHMLLSKF